MKRVYIPTEPGNPSTLWVSDSGNHYRTKKEAQEDHGQIINPDDIRINGGIIGWFKRHKVLTTSVCAAILALAGFTFWYFKLRKK